MANYHVTTKCNQTGKTFTYSVDAETDRKAIHKIIAGIETGSKKGSVVYDCALNQGEGDAHSYCHN
jgi:hypothetical protein